MIITEQQLKQYGISDINIKKYITPINDTLKKYQINTPLKISHFLSQLCHESGRLVYSKEISSGEQYELRKDLGNVKKGDGRKYSGRGAIQITGRSNYTNYGAYIKEDTVNHPELLEQPRLAVDSAGWFWSVYCKRNGLSLNDMAENEWFFKITYHVNGGFRGVQERLLFLKKGYQIFGVTDPDKRLKDLYDYAKGVIHKPVKDKGLEESIFKNIPSEVELNKIFKNILPNQK